MQYHNILFPYGKPEERVPDELLYDLRIDAVLSRLANGPDQLRYDTCYLPLTDKESVLYRHAIFQDIMKEDLYSVFMQFQEMMDSVYQISEKMNRVLNPVMRQRYLLDRILYYTGTVSSFAGSLKEADLHSEGLKLLREDLLAYTAQEDYLELCREAEALKHTFSSIAYRIHVQENHVVIEKASGEADLEFEKELTIFFDQFIHGRASFPGTAGESWELNPVEEQILACLVRLYPEEFARLKKLAAERMDFVPKELSEYHRNLGFYTVWLNYIMPRQDQKLNFCFPMIVDRSEGFMAANCFDMILADRMLTEGRQVVRNNLILKPEEHIMVLTGPNQGGKTTFARMLGQVFYLGALGIPVPGTMVRMFLPDRIFTHFERQEMQSSQTGKLKDDIIRIHDILEQATAESLILINEMFASTTLRDAAWLGKKILSMIERKGAFCLYVTFINELASYLPGSVSLVSEIGEDMEERTYQITRAGADGKAYARGMVKKYALTYEEIRERIGAAYECPPVIQGQDS